MNTSMFELITVIFSMSWSHSWGVKRILELGVLDLASASIGSSHCCVVSFLCEDLL